MGMEKKGVLSEEMALKNIEEYYDKISGDEYARYRSWEHCYNAFFQNRGKEDEKTIDYLSLQLAFYLASWGMYRGSSFLLNRDYRIHTRTVHILLEQKHDGLCGISAENLLKQDSLSLLSEISDEIRKAYQGLGASHVSDILVTKILLGTLGCVPAYDRFYTQTVKKYGISSGAYNSKSVSAVAQYYLMHKDTFESVRKQISTLGTDYPPMKLMDMCMWQDSYREDR